MKFNDHYFHFFLSILLKSDLLFFSIVVFKVSKMSSFFFSLLSSNICRNVSLLDSFFSKTILVTFACFVLLFSSRRVEIVSSLEIVAAVGMLAAVPIAPRVRSCVFCFIFFVMVDMFGSSSVVLMSYETVKLRFNDDFGGIFLLRSHGVVSLLVLRYS